MTAVEAIAKDRYDAYFELAFSPSAGLLTLVRGFVSEFYAHVLADPELASRVSLAAHELLENAVSHSIDGHSRMSIGVRRREGGIEVAIDTRNRAEAAQVAALQGLLDEQAAALDAAEHYQMLMRRAARRADGSGLGLGRARAEAGMSLSCRVVGDSVDVYARATYPAAPAP